MTNEIILAEERLDMEQLDAVSGGTNREYAELGNLLPKVTRGHFGGKVIRQEMVNKKQLTAWLKTNLNIDATISTDSGVFIDHYDDFGALGNPNTYTRNGESLSHSAVVTEVKQFLSVH